VLTITQPACSHRSSVYTEKTRGIEKERQTVGEYHGCSILLAVQEGATDAIDNIMCKLNMESNAASRLDSVCRLQLK
jgi:hypothetical protein